MLLGQVGQVGKPICDDGWDLTAADVACQEIFGTHAILATNNSKFGLVNETQYR